MTAYWLKKQIFNHFIMYTTQIDRDRDFAHFFYKFLCFEVVLPLQIYYITLEDMKKVHLISDFRKKNLLSWGSNPRKWDRTWRNLCPSKPEGQENVLSFGYDFRQNVNMGCIYFNTHHLGINYGNWRNKNHVGPVFKTNDSFVATVL